MKYRVDIYDANKPIKVVLDKRTFIDGVPITDKGSFKIKWRSTAKNIKYKIKKLFPRK